MRKKEEIKTRFCLVLFRIIDGKLSPKMYFIGDWIDNYCDLTLDKMVNETEKAGKRNIVRTISTPQDIKELKEQLGSLTEHNNIFVQTATVPEKKSWFSNIKTVLKGKKK